MVWSRETGMKGSMFPAGIVNTGIARNGREYALLRVGKDGGNVPQPGA